MRLLNAIRCIFHNLDPGDPPGLFTPDDDTCFPDQTFLLNGTLSRIKRERLERFDDQLGLWIDVAPVGGSKR